MPDLTFVLPHWLYWAGLILFPMLAAYLAHRQEQKGTKLGVSLPTSYLLLVTGGFVGLHRFYLRAYQLIGIIPSALWCVFVLWLSGSGLVNPVEAVGIGIAGALGLAVVALWLPLLKGYEAFGYIALFLLVLFGNNRGGVARVELSNAKNDFLGAEFAVGRAQKAVLDGVEGAGEKLNQAQQAVESLQTRLAETEAVWGNWQLFSGVLIWTILALLVIDAFLLPRMTRNCAESEAEAGITVKPIHGPREMEPEDPAARIHTPFTKPIDILSGWSGHFVCYWSMIAVFVYYYEVLARYVFNSPTNWAHEGMFLMFGMQYLLAGAFALREDSHVRVDVLYLYFPDRVKALVDVITSLFFFIFTFGLLITGFIFAWQAVEVWEVSFTEWAIQYWPVKATIAIGGLLIIMQGLAKLIKDIILLVGKET